jgi:hypothetical protein
MVGRWYSRESEELILAMNRLVQVGPGRRRRTTSCGARFQGGGRGRGGETGAREDVESGAGLWRGGRFSWSLHIYKADEHERVPSLTTRL